MKKDPKLMFSESCAGLIELLRVHDRPVTGFENLDFMTRTKLTTSTAMEVVLHSLAVITGADYDEALKLFNSLHGERRLKDICEEMNAELRKYGLDN